MAVVLALGLGACTAKPLQVAPTPTPPALSPSASPTRSAVPVPAYDVERAMAHTRHLAEKIGEREAGSAGYRRAADYAEKVFSSFGYRVTRQRVPLPAGTSAGRSVPAGETVNVIAAPPGFDPAAPHILAGAHLDTVAGTPGANDNGSGAGMLLELARLASIAPPEVPILWVQFGGEERRRPGASGALYGSRRFVSVMGQARREALRRVLVIDMVGHGPRVLVCSSGLTKRDFIRDALAAAARLKIPADERAVRGAFSDYRPFEDAGFVIAWLWSGENATFHTPRDTMAVVQRAEMSRVGRVAWETLRAQRLQRL